MEWMDKGDDNADGRANFRRITCKVLQRGADEIFPLNALAHRVSDLDERDSLQKLLAPVLHRLVEELLAGYCKVVAIILLAAPAGPGDLHTPGTSSFHVERDACAALFERKGDLGN